jgi:predicted deacylase
LSRKVQRLAEASGLLLVEDCDVFDPAHNTLAGAMVDAGVPAFTIEAGGAFAIVEESIATGTDAVLSVLRQLEMIESSADRPARIETPVPLKYTNQPLATSSGLIRFAVTPGQQIEPGQLLAKVYSAFGSCEETFRATVHGLVLGLEDHARVLPGRVVIAIAEGKTGSNRI